ncbi:hypothetical protein GGR57DRAFT_462575 [Xylariaceae sp. FL1272]|nr:hypothetical protein GGR57DRAFT_462575 [Xylariaceae sp. FL1272]
MAPNPIIIPRKPVPRPLSRNQDARRTTASHGTTFVATSVLAVLIATTHWARRWVLSGAAIESLLLLYANGHPTIGRILPAAPLWSLLSALNLAYYVCSTSWLLYGAFTAVCWLVIALTSLAQFQLMGHLCRQVLRKTLGKDPSFVSDRLALFNLPALEIDTEVDGLFVIRGVTISFSSLTIIAHGVEVGIKITGDIELAICVDEVTVRLFRDIEIGDVFANVKGGKFEMTFGEMEDEPLDDNISVDSMFLGNTPLLRAASAGLQGFQSRPKLRQSLTRGSFIKDSSVQDGYDSVTQLSPEDEVADQEYRKRMTEIRTSSPIYQSRQHARRRAEQDKEFELNDEKALRAAVSQELHSLPSVAHPPPRSVRVTTLQNMSSPYVRRFMHRQPFLLRLLLAPLSYFHPIHIVSINAAGSGQWVSELLQQEVFKSYLDTSAELRRLHRKVSSWLANATFCVQLTDIDGLASVPLSTAFDIVAWLKFNDVMAYRTATQSGTNTQVVRLAGADATFTIPTYLLPHHEHLVPPKPTAKDEHGLKVEVEEADGLPKTVEAEQQLEKAKKDETAIEMSVHASLPASFDQTLLNFIAALIKATKIIELEKEVADAESTTASNRTSVDSSLPSVVASSESRPTSPIMSDDDTSSIDTTITTKSKLGLKEVTGFKTVARNIRQNLKDGSYNTTIKEFAKELHQNTKDGMKKAMVGGLVNDRWIAKIVGKTATALQKAQGDVGYSGEIPIPLAPYRGDEDLPSKLLP